MNPTISAPAMNIWNLSYFVTGTYTNMKKVDATITKLGWTTCGAHFSKWPPAKWIYVFVYNSASRIDRYKQDFAFEWGHNYSDHLPICGQFHNYMTRYQWPLKPQGLEFSINNCSRSSSHSEQISADACDEWSLVLRCLCSKIWHISVLPCTVPILKSRVMTQYTSVAQIRSDVVLSGRGQN